MVHQTLTGSISLLALLQPALSMSLSPFAKADSMPARTECQQNVDDHGELYMSPSTLSEYALSCNSDHYGGDLDHVGSDSFLGCIGVCDANPDCIGYAYTPGNCYLKHTYTRKEVSSHVDFALNIQRNLTARPYEAPAKPAPASGSCEYYNEHNWALQGGSRDIKLTGTAMGTNHAPNSHDRALHPQYQFSCGTDHPGGDIGAVGAKTFDSCVDICDTTVDCVGFAWLGGNGPGECYLKGRITDGEANSNVDFASKRSATKKIEVETSISVVPSTSVVASTSVVVSTSVSIVPETPKETSTPLATATETRTIWTLTGSSSIPVATVTSTRIILTPTGLLTVPVKTLLDSAGVPIKSLPAFSPILVKTPSGSASVPVKSLPAFSPILIKTPSGSASVSIKSMSIFSPVPWIAPTGLSSVAGNTSNSIAASPSLTNQLESLKNPLLTVAPFSPHWSTSTKSASGSGDIVESLNTMKIPTSTYISAPAATHVLPSLDSVPSEPSDIPMVPETPSYPRSCSELRASGDRKLRTRVTRGNMDYDGLFLTQWDPNLGKEKCRENSCSRSVVSYTFLTSVIAEAGNYFMHPLSKIVGTWTHDVGCDFHSMKLIPMDQWGEAQGMVKFTHNTWQNANSTMMARVSGNGDGLVEGNLAETEAELLFDSFVVCPARHKFMTTGEENEGKPYLQFWQIKQKKQKKDKFKQKKCAMVKLEMVK